MTDDAGLAARITAYLSGGGLFNPELANHDAVRDLLIDCRAALTRPLPEATHVVALKDHLKALGERNAALSEVSALKHDAERYRWAKSILSGDNAVEADAKARILAAGLMANLDPDVIIDAARKGASHD